MVHRFTSLGLLTLSAWFAWLAPPAEAGELLRSPGWLAVLPDDSQPSVPEVRAKGREWFVDANKGDDMGAGSKASPWKTLGRLKRASLGSGDVIRLRCGSVWRETWLIDGRSWPAGVTVASDGPCPVAEMPSIRGSDVVESVWQADATQPGVHVTDRFGGVKALFHKGQRLVPARMPDAAGVGREFAQADGQNSLRSFRLRDKERRQVGDRDLVGATVYVRAVPWQVEKATVSRYDPSTGVLTLDKDLTSTILSGAGYILEGKRWMVTSPGEWFHDPRDKRLYLMPVDGQRPKPGDLEAVTRDQAVVLRDNRQLRLVGLDMRQTSQAAVDLQDVKDVAIEGFNVVDPGEHGILVYRSSGVTVKGSRIGGAGWGGILTRDAAQSVIAGNLIVDTGLLGQPGGSRGAIVLNGEGSLAERNLVMRAANSGIYFMNKPGTRILNNVVIWPCSRMADCGGIYTWTAHSPDQATRRRVQRALVQDNVVLGGAGNLEGTAGRGRNQSVGVYLDEMTGGTQVIGNLLAGMENGFYLHNAQFNDIQRNAVRSVSHASFTAHLSLQGVDVIRGNRVRDNSLVARPAARGGDEVFAFKWQQRTDPSALFAGDDANEVQDNVILRAGVDGHTRWYVGEGLSGRTLAANDWKRFAQQDKEQVIKLAPDGASPVKPEGPSLIADGGASSWMPYFNPAGAGGGLANAQCDGKACLRFVAGHPGDVLSSKPFQLSNQADRNGYVLRYVAKAGPKGGSIRATVRRNGPPYESFGLEQSPLRLQPGQVVQVELPFEASSADPARLDFSAEPGAEVFLNRISLVRVEGAPSRTLTVARSLLLVNLSEAKRSLTCADAGLSSCAAIDERGQDVTWPVALAPRQWVAVYPRQAGQ